MLQKIAQKIASFFKEQVVFHKSNGYFWFRFGSIGLCFKNLAKHPFLDSSCRRLKKNWRIGGWSIELLDKNYFSYENGAITTSKKVKTGLKY